MSHLKGLIEEHGRVKDSERSLAVDYKTIWPAT